MKRPAAFSCAAFLLCLLAGTYFVSGVKWIASIVFFAVGTVILLCRGKQRVVERRPFRICAIPLLAASLAFLISYICVDCGYRRDAERFEGEKICTFLVTKSVKNDPYFAVYEITLDGIGDEKTDVRAELMCGFDASYREGSRYRAAVSLEGADHYALSKGFSLSAYQPTSDAVFLESGVSDFPYTAISKLHTGLSVRLRAYLDPESAGVSEALLDGERADLPGKLSKPFRQLGLSHLLAISGLHLSVLFGLAALFLKKAGASPKIQTAVLTPLLLAYIFLTDFAPSVIRASLMLLCTYLATLFRRKSDPVTSLLLSVSLICLLSQRSVMDTGLQLSFFATLGIILAALPVIERLPQTGKPFMKLMNGAASAVLITAAAVLFTLPVSALAFGSVSWVSIFTNLLFTIPVTLLLIFVLLFAVFSFLPFTAVIAAYPVRFFSHLLIEAADRLASPRALLVIDGLPIILLLIFGLLAVVLLLLFRKNAWTYTVLPLIMIPLLIINAFAWKRADETAVLSYVTESAGDALLFTSGDRLLIVDISGGTYRFFADTLEKADAGNKKISILFTHYHNYAPYALSRLLPKYDFETLYLMKPVENGIHGFDALRTFAGSVGLSVCELPESAELTFGDTALSVESKRSGKNTHPDVTVSAQTPEKTYFYTTSDVLETEETVYIHGSHNAPKDAPTTPEFTDRRKMKR